MQDSNESWDLDKVANVIEYYVRHTKARAVSTRIIFFNYLNLMNIMCSRYTKFTLSFHAFKIFIRTPATLLACKL